MAFNFPILSATIWLPIVGGVWIICSARLAGDTFARWSSLFFAATTFLLSVLLWCGFDTSTADMQFGERLPWIRAFGIDYAVGIDGIALPLILLTY